MKRIAYIQKAIGLGCQVEIKGIGSGMPLAVKRRGKCIMVKVRFYHPFKVVRWISDKRPARYFYWQMV